MMTAASGRSATRVSTRLMSAGAQPTAPDRNVVPKRTNECNGHAEFFRIWLIVDAIEERKSATDAPPPTERRDMLGDASVRCKHAFFHQACCTSGAFHVSTLWLTVAVELEAELERRKVNATAFEASAAKRLRERVNRTEQHSMVAFTAFENPVHLFIREAALADNGAFRDTVANTLTIRTKFHEDRVGKAFLPRNERAHVVRENFREHRNDTINKVDARSALECFAIEWRIFRDERTDIGDMDAKPHVTVREQLERKRIVEVFCIRRVNGDNLPRPEIFASATSQW